MTTQILIAGFGGQGVLFAGKFLAYKGLLEEKQVSWLPSYGPEMRGGTANCSIILSDDPVGSPIVSTPDALIAMNLGVMNMLPIPALDGGRVFFRIIEILRFGKPVSPKFEATVHGLGMTLLLMATAVIAFKDLFQLF